MTLESAHVLSVSTVLILGFLCKRRDLCCGLYLKLHELFGVLNLNESP